MIYLNATEFANKVGVSKQRVMQWIGENKLSCWKPCKGVYMIPEKQDRPKAGKPGRPTNLAKSLVYDK